MSDSWGGGSDDDGSAGGRSDDDYGAASEDDAGGASGHLPSTTPWKVITTETLLSAQAAALAHVTSVLGVGTHAARTLLIHHRWSEDALFSAFAEHGLEDTLRAAGVLSRTADEAAPAAVDDAVAVACGSCLCDVPPAQATRMPCGHAFCNDCWLSYLRVKIGDGQSRRVTCMAFKCGAICDDALVARLVASDVEAGARYHRALLESYIEDNAKVKWCPSVPHCGAAVEVAGEPHCEPQCACGHRFCFACGDTPHSPCTCAMLRLWKVKCADESETVNWLSANTKPCPKCAKAVEKNGGCNLVACTCGQCFCWLCGQATGRDHTWTSIAGHACGRYRDDAEAAAERAQRDLARYLHFHGRWKAHADSAALEERHRAEVAAKITAAEAAADAQLRDYSWLTVAQTQLFIARRILSCSYVFAYYYFGAELFADELPQADRLLKQDLFDDHRDELERCVEALSRRVEAPMEELTDATRLEVVNLTALADARCANVYEIVEHDLLGALPYTAAHVAPYRGGSAAVARSAAAARARAAAEAAAAEEAAAAAAAEAKAKAKAQAEAEVAAAAEAAAEAARAGAAGSGSGSLSAGAGDAAGGAAPARREHRRPLPAPRPLPPPEQLAAAAAAAAAAADDGGAGGGRRKRQRGGRARASAAAAAAAAADVIDLTLDGAGPADAAAAAGASGAAVCPVCALAFDAGASNEVINAHVDACLAVAGGGGDDEMWGA